MAIIGIRLRGAVCFLSINVPGARSRSVPQPFIVPQAAAAQCLVIRVTRLGQHGGIPRPGTASARRSAEAAEERPFIHPAWMGDGVPRGPGVRQGMAPRATGVTVPWLVFAP